MGSPSATHVARVRLLPPGTGVRDVTRVRVDAMPINAVGEENDMDGGPGVLHKKMGAHHMVERDMTCSSLRQESVISVPVTWHVHACGPPSVFVCVSPSESRPFCVSCHTRHVRGGTQQRQLHIATTSQQQHQHQHNTTQHNTTQHSTAQHNTTQHNTTHRISITSYQHHILVTSPHRRSMR